MAYCEAIYVRLTWINDLRSLGFDTYLPVCGRRRRIAMTRSFVHAESLRAAGA